MRFSSKKFSESLINDVKNFIQKHSVYKVSLPEFPMWCVLEKDNKFKNKFGEHLLNPDFCEAIRNLCNNNRGKKLTKRLLNNNQITQQHQVLKVEGQKPPQHILNVLEKTVPDKLLQWLVNIIKNGANLEPNMEAQMRSFYHKKATDIGKADPTVEDIFEHACKQPSPELQMECFRFFETVWGTALVNKDTEKDVVSEIRDYMEYNFEESTQTQEKAVLWYQISKPQVAILIKFVSVSKYQLNALQGTVVSDLFTRCEFDLKEFKETFGPSDKGIRVVAWSKCFELDKSAAELLSQRPNEFIHESIIRRLKVMKNLPTEAFLVFQAIVGVACNRENFQMLLDWVKNKTLLKVLTKISGLKIDFHAVKLPIQQFLQLQELEPQINKQLLGRLNSITSIQHLVSELNKVCNVKEELRSGQSLAIVKSSLVKVIKEQLKKPQNEREQFLTKHDALTSIISEFVMKRGFGPFDWQELLITFIAVCMTKEKKHVMMQMTTGYGKSPTASVLAKLLIDTTDHNVIFVCLTPYLKHTALARYGWEQQTRQISQPPAPGRRILMVTIDELHQVSEKEVKNSFLIFDEIDSCFKKVIAYFQPSATPRVYTAKYLPEMLKLAKGVCGLTGTFTPDAFDILQVNPEQPFVYIEVPKLLKSVEHTFYKLVQFEGEEERGKKIIQEVDEALNQGQSVILIDGKLDEKEYDGNTTVNQALSTKHAKYFLFNDWRSSNFGQIETQLKVLSGHIGTVIVHTNRAGAIGVDFKTKLEARVIAALNPQSSQEGMQIIGRGCRDVERGSRAVLITDQKLEIEPQQIMNHLRSYEQGNRQNEGLRNCVMKKIHNLSGRANKEEIQKLTDIINKAQPLHFSADEEDAEAKKNYQLIKTFIGKKGGLPPYPSGLFQ